MQNRARIERLLIVYVFFFNFFVLSVLLFFGAHAAYDEHLDFTLLFCIDN